MSHPPLQTGMMAPDSHAAMHNTTTTSPSTSPLLQDTPTTPTDPSALLTLMAIGPTPTPPPSSLPLAVSGGILSKGSTLKKRVSFRDSNLVSVREIPPRPRRVSSSEEDGEDNDEEDSDDDEEDSASSDSDDDSEDSDSEEEEKVRGKGGRRQMGTITGKSVTPSFRTVAKTRSSPSPANSSLSSPRARSDRTHTSHAATSNTSGVTSAKGSYHVTSSPTSRVVSLVSQITGVSSVATQTHIKQRKTAAATVSKPPATSTPKQVTAVLKVDKKVKKISPNMDGGATTSQTVRAAQNKDGAPAVAAVGRVGQGKATRKKRGSQLLRRQDGTEKRKPVTLRKTKETKNTTKTCGSNSNNVNGAVPERVKCKLIVNGISTARDSLSLPPLGGGGGGGGEETPLPSKPLLPHTATRIKTPIFSVDGFIFPGDLAMGVKVKNATGKTEDAKLPLPVPKPAKERLNSAPPGSPGRRKRCHAWHMANGDLENNLQEPPSITPMWETVTPVGAASSPVLPSR